LLSKWTLLKRAVAFLYAVHPANFWQYKVSVIHFHQWYTADEMLETFVIATQMKKPKILI
jgi:hypothetical protein